MVVLKYSINTVHHLQCSALCKPLDFKDLKSDVCITKQLFIYAVFLSLIQTPLLYNRTRNTSLDAWPLWEQCGWMTKL